VAFSAENGYVHLVCSGLDISRRQDVMFSVAFAASRSVGSSAFQGSSMNSSVKFLIGFVMANPAVHSLKSLGVGEFFHICIYMARRAV